MLKRLERRPLVVTLGAVVLFAAAFSLLGRFAHFHDLVDAAEEANKWWFPVCLLGEILAYVGYIMAYRDAARADGGPLLAFWTVVRVVVIGFGAFFVGSSVGGLAVDYWALREAGAGRHESTRRVLALNTLEWGVLAAAACVSGALLLAGAGVGAPAPMALGWLIVVPLCVAAAIWTTQPARVERLTRQPPRTDAHTISERLWRFIRVAFADAIGGVVLVRYIVFHAPRYPGAIFGFAVYWAGDLLTLYAALRAFGVHAHPLALILAYTTAYVANAIPLPAGGAGGVDAALVLTLTAIGVPLAPAILGVLVYRGFSFWLPVLPAVLFLPAVRTLQRDIEAADREDDHAFSRAPNAEEVPAVRPCR